MKLTHTLKRAAVALAILSTSVASFASESAVTEYPIDSICYKVKVFPTQEPSTSVAKCRIEGNVMFVEGVVDTYLVYEIKSNKKIKHLELNSYGGLVEAGYEIAEYVRKNKITTNVRKGAKCGSICTVIFQAGVKRTAHSSVRFLYHGTRLNKGWLRGWSEVRDMKGREWATKFVVDQISAVRAETDIMFAKYVEYGMNPKFIDEYNSQPIENDWFENGNFGRVKDYIVGTDVMLKNNIVTGLDPREEF